MRVKNYDQLLQQLSPAIRKLAKKINQRHAEDLYQEVSLFLFKNYNLCLKQNKQYVFGCCKNTMFNWLRNNKIIFEKKGWNIDDDFEIGTSDNENFELNHVLSEKDLAKLKRMDLFILNRVLLGSSVLDISKKLKVSRQYVYKKIEKLKQLKSLRESIL